MQWKPLVAAVVVAVVGAALLFLYLERFEAEATGGPKVSVLVAAKAVPLGTILTEDMIAAQGLPQAYLEDRHIPESERAQAIGVRVRTEIRPGESILWSDLATASGQRRDLSSLVQPNMRALSVRTQKEAFGGLVRPGDRVDLLLTTEREASPVTFLLQQNLLLLAVGKDVGGEGSGTAVGRGGTNHQITLSVTPEQSQAITEALKIGELSFVLRNPEDLGIHEKMPETTRSDVLQEERRRNLNARERPVDTAPAVQGPTELTR